MFAGRNSRDVAKQQTREALIRAGMAEFVEHGLDTPSLDAICARAGFTRGAFYVHFRDRDDFTVAVMESVLGDFLDAVIGGEKDAGGLEDTVSRFASAVLQGNPVTGERGSMRTHHLIDVCVRSEEIRTRFLELLGEAQRRVASAAQTGQRAGAIRGDLPADAIGWLLVVLAMGVVQTFELGMPLALEQMREITLRVLAPDPASSGDAAGPRTHVNSGKAARTASRGRSRR